LKNVAKTKGIFAEKGWLESEKIMAKIWQK
jgi:hypothetical protein